MKTLFLLLAAFWHLTSSAQTCYCEASKSKLYNRSGISLCGNVYDSSSAGRLIGEFTLCNKDVVLVDNFHNEGASFLYQTERNRLLFTEIDLRIDNGEYLYPKTFHRFSYTFSDNQWKRQDEDVDAAPLVEMLKKKFKQTSKLY